MGNNLITDAGDVDVYFTKYKSYVALLNQDAEGSPTALVLNGGDSNYLGDIAWTRQSVGTYSGNYADPMLPELKTFIIVNANSYGVYAQRGGDYYITVFTFFDLGTREASDGVMYNMPIEIRVYQ